MTFVPQFWLPLFEKLDELCACLGEGGGGGSAVYPQWGERFHDDAHFIGVAGKFLLPDEQPYGFAMSQSNDGDEWQHGFLLAATPAAPYIVTILGFNSPSGGIMDLYIDAQLVQQFDYYSATSDYNTIWQAPLDPAWTPTDKIYLLRGVTNGKNVSSSGYENWITKISVRPYLESL